MDDGGFGGRFSIMGSYITASKVPEWTNCPTHAGGAHLGVQRKNSPFSYVPPGISGEAGELQNLMTMEWRLLEYFPNRATYKE